MIRRSSILFSLAVFVWGASGTRLGAEDAPPAAPKKPWSNNTEVSLVTANGNTKTTTTKLSELFKYDWIKELLELQASGLGASQENQVTAEEYHASEKLGWKFTERNYAFEQGTWDKNRFAGIQNRYEPTAGYGRKILNSDADKLNAELGAGYIFEKHTDGTQRNYMNGRAYLDYTHLLSATSNFLQQAEYLPRVDDPSDFRVTTKTALTAALTTHLSLQSSFEWKRQNRPPAGFQRDDTITSVALVVNY